MNIGITCKTNIKVCSVMLCQKLLAISARKSLKAKQIEVSQAQQSFKDIKQCSKCGRFWKDRKDYGFHTPIAHKDQ